MNSNYECQIGPILPYQGCFDRISEDQSQQLHQKGLQHARSSRRDWLHLGAHSGSSHHERVDSAGREGLHGSVGVLGCRMLEEPDDLDGQVSPRPDHALGHPVSFGQQPPFMPRCRLFDFTAPRSLCRFGRAAQAGSIIEADL